MAASAMSEIQIVFFISNSCFMPGKMRFHSRKRKRRVERHNFVNSVKVVNNFFGEMLARVRNPCEKTPKQFC